MGSGVRGSSSTCHTGLSHQDAAGGGKQAGDRLFGGPCPPVPRVLARRKGSWGVNRARICPGAKWPHTPVGQRGQILGLDPTRPSGWGHEGAKTSPAVVRAMWQCQEWGRAGPAPVGGWLIPSISLCTPKMRPLLGCKQAPRQRVPGLCLEGTTQPPAPTCVPGSPLPSPGRSLGGLLCTPRCRGAAGAAPRAGVHGRDPTSPSARLQNLTQKRLQERGKHPSTTPRDTHPPGKTAPAQGARLARR